MKESTMPVEQIRLPEVDEVQITTITDNSLDMLMASTDVAKRFPLRKDLFDHAFPVAEHGYSVLIRVRSGDRRGTVLFDTGVSRKGILWNFDALDIDAKEIQAIVLSHGHADHAMGFSGIVDRLGPRGIPLVIHPDAYLERKLVLPNGDEFFLRPPTRADLRRENIELIESVEPSTLIDGMFLVSGEVERTTEFEIGMSVHHARRNGVWGPDPLIPDDQCAIMRVRGKGLVIVTGCGHSGIINVIRNAQRLTGIDKVYAVMGGFHLTGGLFERIIPPTVAALKQIAPRYVIPGHCTGYAAMIQIAQAMPESFVPNSVGTTMML
jgi:7,8-dihydropterin-6-yl-methyl-4-(beta-D-ribofuranosyl)aminobenzene 5'-phosphate synthase